MPTISCLTCGKQKHYKPFIIKSGGGKYCSYKCFSLNKIGKHCTEETKRKMRKAKKGKMPKNVGISFAMIGEKSFQWKGDNASYRAKHHWINNNYGKPKKCEICSKETNGHKIGWANKDHKYKRIRKDWFIACAKCHGIYDKNNGLRKRKEVY